MQWTSSRRTATTLSPTTNPTSSADIGGDSDSETLLDACLESPELHTVSARPLALPFCLPQSTVFGDAPFLRGWNEELETSGIHLLDWLGFVDGLNIVMTASPPLRIVDLAGKAISLVPYHWSIITGIAMQAGAQGGMHIIQKTQTDRYLRRANAQYFAPRGLRARICRDRAVRRLIGLTAGPEGAAVHAKRTVTKIGLYVPLAREVIHRRSAPVPPISAATLSSTTLADRRLCSMGYGTHALPVSTEGLPSPAVSSGAHSKSAAVALKMDAWLAGRVARQRARHAARVAGRADNSETAELDKDPKRRRRAEKRAKRDEEKANIANRIEALSNDGALWLVLLTAEDDLSVIGREHFEDDSDTG